MSLHVDVWNYRQSTVHEEEIIFSDMDDQGVYDRNRAWDLLPSHLFTPARRNSGSGIPAKATFKSREDAIAGLETLNELKTQVKA